MTTKPNSKMEHHNSINNSSSSSSSSAAENAAHRRRLAVLLIVTIAAVPTIILTFTSSLSSSSLHSITASSSSSSSSSGSVSNSEHQRHHDNHQTQRLLRQRSRRRQLQIMGKETYLDPKTITFKNNNDNEQQQQLFQPLHLQPQQQLQEQQPQQQQPQQQQISQQFQPPSQELQQQPQYPISPQGWAQQQQMQQSQQQQQQFQSPQSLEQQSQQQVQLQPQNIISQDNTNIINNAINTNNNINFINANTSHNKVTPPTIKPYNINSILKSMSSFRYQGFIFTYSSSTNDFTIIHATPTCDLGCVRIYRIASIVAYALRKNFPLRFPLNDDGEDGGGGGGTIKFVSGENGIIANNNVNTAAGGGGGDLAFTISTGDVPRIHQYCLDASTNYCSSHTFGPILQFGSIFTNMEYLPSMIAMPQPVRPHMPCFDEWQLHGRVCNDLQPAQYNPNGGEEFNGISSFASGLVFGKELGIVDDSPNNNNSNTNYWNELIPQIIWRGTDFVFLHTMFPKMRRPDYNRDIASKESKFRIPGSDNEKRWAINAAWEMGEALQPRWRGVLLTSEAELDAQEFREGGDVTLPWVNIKFASCNFNRKKVDASENPEFVKLQEVGIQAIGERVNMVEQAKYRYHIDLGGGGGTSWTGTIEKLALPGVLFHHVTPTKDWFYDRLQPWVHYIPVNSDLTDLREKFEWAESHPVEAQKIAEAGTEFARWIGTPEGFGELYEQHLVAPLRGIINAYQPSPDASDAGKSVLDIIQEKGSPEYTVVSRCSGSFQYSCKDLDGKIPNGS